MDALEALRKASQTAIQAESDWLEALDELSQRIQGPKRSEAMKKVFGLVYGRRENDENLPEL